MSAGQVDRKAKTKLPPQPVRSRPAEERIHDFAPVKISYDAEEARAEASRCLLCPNQACTVACPLSNDIPSAMRLISEGKFIDAAAVYQATSTLPDVCSRVCPQDNLCEGACVLGKHGQAVALGALERFVSDYARVHAGPVTLPPSTGSRVAVVGAGPAGLSAAQRLRERGHEVTCYESMPAAGGWLAYAIPTYKLPREIVTEKIATLEKLGIQFVFNTRVGKDIALSDLREQYDAVFLGLGAMIDAQVEIEGRELDGVYTGTEFLLPIYVAAALRPPDIDWPEVGRRVAVFGGGDTAMDCVRTAVRLQSQRGWVPDVNLVYRRTEQEMPASYRERKYAMEEGIQFTYLEAPIAFTPGPDGRVKEVIIQRMELGEPGSDGRRRPVPIEGDTYTMPVDTAILALGYWPDPLMGKHEPELETHKWGLIVVNEETGETNLPGVYAGGDAVRGPNLVSRAALDGIRAANAIHAFLEVKRTAQSVGD